MFQSLIKFISGSIGIHTNLSGILVYINESLQSKLVAIKRYTFGLQIVV